jgi:hypothetical protein
VAPNGVIVDIDSGSFLRPLVNGAISSSLVSNVKTAASSFASSQLKRCMPDSRATGSVLSMLPLTSNSSATLTPARSRRKSEIGRGRPASRISKSAADKF